MMENVIPDPALLYEHHHLSLGNLQITMLVAEKENEELDVIYVTEMERGYPEDKPVMGVKYALFWRAESPAEAFMKFDEVNEAKWKEVQETQNLDEKVIEEKVKAARAQNMAAEFAMRQARQGGGGGGRNIILPRR